MSQPESLEEEQVSITLSHDQALVLYGLFVRWEETNNDAAIAIEHPAELRVLWNILSDLESALVDPLLHNYHERLDHARRNVQDPR